jgi:hypothetical protein
MYRASKQRGISMHNPKVTLNDLLQEAVELMKPGVSQFSANALYLRGMCELAARLFPVPGLEMGERAEEIERRILVGEWD